MEIKISKISLRRSLLSVFIMAVFFVLTVHGGSAETDPPVCLEETVDGKPAYRMTMLKTGR